MLLAAAPAGPGGRVQAAELVGTWRGASTCTDRVHFPACNDEVVVYDVRPLGEAGDSVTLRADKLVHGSREFMYQFDFARGPGGEWTAEFQTPRAHGRWVLQLSGGRLTGRLVDIPSGRMVRQVALERAR